jgi:hypothetical protein
MVVSPLTTTVPESGKAKVVLGVPTEYVYVPAGTSGKVTELVVVGRVVRFIETSQFWPLAYPVSTKVTE